MFSQQQDTLAQLNSEIQQIKTGTTGPGFSAPELAAKTSQIETGAAAGARNAQQAAQNQGAGQTFGDTASGLQSGIRKQIAGQIASNATTNEANQLTNLTAENYAQGRANAAATMGGLSTIAGIENPLGYAGAASGATQAGFDEANKINEQEIAKAQAVTGLITGGLSTGLKFLTGGLGNLDQTGSSSGWEQAQNFFTGGMSGMGGGS
jgi:hypothetical protein